MELPVVSTFHSGIPEIVHDSVTVLLRQQRNFETVSEQLLYLLSSGDPVRVLGPKAREFICSVFVLDRQTARSEDSNRKANAGGARSALRAVS